MHPVTDFLVRQLTQTTNTIRAHLGEFGIVTPKGVQNAKCLLAWARPPTYLRSRAIQSLLAEQFRDSKVMTEDVTAEIRAGAHSDETVRRLQMTLGIGPITSSVPAAMVLDVCGFRSTHDLTTWIGLTPRPHSSGGNERLERISKMGNRYIRRLLYLGAMAQIGAQ